MGYNNTCLCSFRSSSIPLPDISNALENSFCLDWDDDEGECVVLSHCRDCTDALIGLTNCLRKVWYSPINKTNYKCEINL